MKNEVQPPKGCGGTPGRPVTVFSASQCGGCADCRPERPALYREIESLRASLAAVTKELDTVKRDYCREIAEHGERIYGSGDCCAWNTAYKVCIEKWPADAERLYPPGSYGRNR